MRTARVLAVALSSAVLAGVACSSFGADDVEPPPGGGDAAPEGGAEAGPDGGQAGAIGFGTGQKVLDVLAGSAIAINAYGAITIPAAAGSTTVTLADTTPFSAGSVVMVHVMKVSTLSNEPRIEIAQTDLGRFSLHRVRAVEGLTLTLEHPLEFAVVPNEAQVISVPEYASAKIAKNSNVVPKDYTEVGGVVAFLVGGDLEIEGKVDVDGAGYAGAVPDPQGSTLGCDAGTGAPNAGYAPRGEGATPRGSTDADNPIAGGFQRFNTGGGGGNCHNAGGGGGGSGGGGGHGGTSSDGFRDVGGQGGAKLASAAANRLLFGGGGGAGEQNDAPAPKSGGKGGGAIFIRARRILGTGSFLVNGKPGQDQPGSTTGNGGTGGGAGGTIILQTEGSIPCQRLEAKGGPGGEGSGLTGQGPGGGGGGGGFIVLQPGVAAGCAPDLTGGAPGQVNNGGATAGAAGEIVTIPMPFAP